MCLRILIQQLWPDFVVRVRLTIGLDLVRSANKPAGRRPSEEELLSDRLMKALIDHTDIVKRFFIRACTLRVPASFEISRADVNV